MGCPLGMLPPAWLCGGSYFALNPLTPVVVSGPEAVGLGAPPLQGQWETLPWSAGKWAGKGLVQD